MQEGVVTSANGNVHEMAQITLISLTATVKDIIVLPCIRSAHGPVACIKGWM